MGIPASSLWNWIRKKRSGKLAIEAGSGDGVMREMARLQRENANLKLDNEILRKAAAYFAKGSR